MLLSLPPLHTHIHRLAAFSHKLKQLFMFPQTHSSLCRHSVPEPHLQVQRHLQLQAFYMMFRNVIVADRGGWYTQNLHTEKRAVPSQWRRDSLAQSWVSIIKTFNNITPRDFPGGAVDKNLPANAGDMGLIPGPGRSCMWKGNLTYAPQILEPVCLEPVLGNKRSHDNEKPKHSNEE